MSWSKLCMAASMRTQPAALPYAPVAFDWSRDVSEYCTFCLSMYCRDLEQYCLGCDAAVCTFCAAWLEETGPQCPPCVRGEGAD